MPHKQKLLDALNITFDDLSEDRLLDILLDAYKAKKQRIAALEVENAQERERLQNDLECVRRERQRMREDPLYCVAGEFFFKGRSCIIGVVVRGGHIQAFERQSGIDYLAAPATCEEAGAWP